MTKNYDNFTLFIYIVCEMIIIKNEWHLEETVLPRKSHRWAVTHSYRSWPQVSWAWRPHRHHQTVKSTRRELMKIGEMKCMDLDGTARVGGMGYPGSRRYQSTFAPLCIDMMASTSSRHTSTPIGRTTESTRSPLLPSISSGRWTQAMA